MGITIYLLYATLAFLAYSLINHIFVGRKRYPGNFFNIGVNLLYFIFGFKMIWYILNDSHMMGLNSQVNNPPGEVQFYYYSWVAMNIIGITTPFVIAVPLTIFLYKVCCTHMFFEQNYYDLSVNQL